MKVLVVGSGGREHAMVWKIAQSSLVDKVYCAPGNPGTALIGQNVPIIAESPKGIEDLYEFCFRNRIDLVWVGPEKPLTLGIVDIFEEGGIKIVGPRMSAAKIEGSKAFSKHLMNKYEIPTARYKTFSCEDSFIKVMNYIGDQEKFPIVIKADGLAAGKGVVICQTKVEAYRVAEAMLKGESFGDAGRMIVIEEFLEGEEASFQAFTDGVNIIPLASAQDHKAKHDDDLGPNTGGMGAYSPAPVVTPAIHDFVMKNIMQRAVDGLRADGRLYKGALYAGLMIKGDNVKTLEFNARFGDPECQPLLMRMKSDIVPILLAVTKGDISGIEIEWLDKTAVCVVMAAENYPGPPVKGDEIIGLEDAIEIADCMVFHAGTAIKDGKLVTAGGRVLGVTALGDSVQEAIDSAYDGVCLIEWRGEHNRKDIGLKALRR